MAAPVCPKCGTALRDEYGMQQCPGCGAFLFVDMDGVATSPQDTASAGPEIVVDDSAAAGGDSPMSLSGASVDPQYAEHPVPEPGGAASSSDFGDPIEGLIDTPAAEPVADQSGSADNGFGFDPFANSGEPPAADAPGAQNDFQPIEMGFGSDPSETGEAPSDAQSEVRSPNSSGAAAPGAKGTRAKAERPPQAVGPAGDPLGLNEFSNSEISSAKDGPLLFRVLISGIDTKEIRDSIREVIEDERFRWDPNDLVAKIAKGALVIDDLSPVKASILITKIKKLPVTIRWEQYAISQGHST